MEGDNQETTDKQQFAPQGYKPMPYLPAKKVDAEDKLEELDQTKL